MSTYFLAINRNKRSIAIDLKTEQGQRIANQLVDEADILLENFRPGTMAKLGLSSEVCRKRNPKLIYCSISAFGHNGLEEWSRRPGYDLILQGMGGFQALRVP